MVAEYLSLISCNLTCQSHETSDFLKDSDPLPATAAAAFKRSWSQPPASDESELDRAAWD